MKTATIPSLRVDPKFREAVESVLQKDETISSFVELSLKKHIRTRQVQQQFVNRGLASRDEAKETGEYYDADEVLAGLDSMLAEAEKG